MAWYFLFCDDLIWCYAFFLDLSLRTDDPRLLKLLPHPTDDLLENTLPIFAQSSVDVGYCLQTGSYRRNNKPCVHICLRFGCKKISMAILNEGEAQEGSTEGHLNSRWLSAPQAIPQSPAPSSFTPVSQCMLLSNLPHMTIWSKDVKRDYLPGHLYKPIGAALSQKAIVPTTPGILDDEACKLAMPTGAACLWTPEKLTVLIMLEFADEMTKLRNRYKGAATKKLA